MAATLTPAAPAPTDRERIWTAIREMGRGGTVFTSFDLALKTKLTRRSSALGEYLTGLEKAGFLQVVNEKKTGVSNLYELVRDVGVAAPRVTKAGAILPLSGRTRMWRAMRILGTFSARELADAASLAGAAVAVSEAESYCRWLTRGGYLRDHGGTGGSKRWRFIPAMDSGPKAPQILRVKKLYDPNRDAVVYETSGQGRDDV